MTLVYEAVFALYPPVTDVVNVEVVNNDWLMLFSETIKYVRITRHQQFACNDHNRPSHIHGRHLWLSNWTRFVSFVQRFFPAKTHWTEQTSMLWNTLTHCFPPSRYSEVTQKHPQSHLTWWLHTTDICVALIWLVWIDSFCLWLLSAGYIKIFFYAM